MRQTTSAIFGAFNVESFIGEAVSSISSQVDEVVIVEDNSTDGTLAEVHKIAKSFENVRVFENKENLGVSVSYNVAAQKAKGEIVFICGGDDISLPDRVSLQLEELRDIPNSVASFSKPELIRSDGLSLDDFTAPEFFPNPKNNNFFGHLLFLGNFLLAPSAALSRKLFLSLGGFTPNLDLLQDYELWLKISRVGDLVVSTHPTIKYRKRLGSSSGYRIETSRHSKREAAERSYILSRVLNTCDRTALENAISYLGLNKNAHRNLSDAEIKASLKKLLKVEKDDYLEFGSLVDFGLTLSEPEDLSRARQQIKTIFD